MLTQIFTDITTQDTHTHTHTPQPISSKHGHENLKIRCTDQPVCITYWELPFHQGEVVQLGETVVCHYHGNVGCDFQA